MQITLFLSYQPNQTQNKNYSAASDVQQGLQNDWKHQYEVSQGHSTYLSRLSKQQISKLINRSINCMILIN